MKKTAIALMTLVLAGTATAQGPTTSLETEVLTTDPVPVQSGEDADISLRVRSTGSTEAEDVNVTILDTYPFEVKPDRDRSREIGDLSPGQRYFFSTELLVAEDAPDGNNSLRVRIETASRTFTKTVDIEVQSQDIELDVVNLGTEPTELAPDVEDASLTAEVTNNGDKGAENVVMTLSLPDGFEETSTFSTRQSLGTLSPGEVKEAEFVFDVGENASSGTRQMPAEITYSADDDTGEVTLDRSFELFLSGRPQYEVAEFEGGLQQGESDTVTLRFRNVGSEESESTRVRILESGDQPFTYSSASDFVGTVEPGAEATATFDVSADSSAELQEYLVDFEFRGVDSTEVFVEDTTQRLEVQDSAGGSGSSPLPIIVAGMIVAAAVIGFVFRSRLRTAVNNIR